MLIRNRERKKLIFVLLLSLLPSEYSWAQSLVARVQATQLSAGTHYTWTYFQSVDSNGLRSPAARAPSMIDEYPILSVAAAFAEGADVQPTEIRVPVDLWGRPAELADAPRARLWLMAGDTDFR